MSGPAIKGLAGALTQRVSLLRRAETRDDLGGASGGWAAFATVWAALAPDGVGTGGEGDVRPGRARWRATLRPVAIRVGDRVQGNGPVLDVLRIEADPATPDRIALWLEDAA